MSDPVAVALIMACASVPPACAAFFSAFFSYRAAVHSKESLAVSRQTQLQTNGLADKIEAAALIKGKSDERETQTERGNPPVGK
jgi:hypothetical protein